MEQSITQQHVFKIKNHVNSAANAGMHSITTHSSYVTAQSLQLHDRLYI